MARPNKTGRATESRHIRLYRFLTDSAAWQHLSGTATKALVYLATWEDGSNNGEIYMSVRMLAKGINTDKKTAARALRELEDKGFIVAEERGWFRANGGPATKWRLTWLSWPAASKGPSHEYRVWKPEQKSSGEKLPAVVGEIPRLKGSEAVVVGDSPPSLDTKPQKTANRDRGEKGTHSVATVEAAPDHPEQAIRRTVMAFWNAATPERRRALASRTGLRLEEVRGYLDNGNPLPFPKQIALRSAARGLAA